MIQTELIKQYSAPIYKEGIVDVKRGSFINRKGWKWFCVIANGNDCKPLCFPNGNQVCVHGNYGYDVLRDYFKKAEWLGRTWKNNDSPAWKIIK